MPNPLYQALAGGQMPGMFGPFQLILQQFNQFRQNFHGDPQKEVEKLLQSGRMSQQQLNQLQQAAQIFQPLL